MMRQSKKGHKKALFLVIVTALGVALAGCGTTGKTAGSAGEEPKAENNERILSITFTTEDEEETRDDAFPESWGFYKLSGISYEVVNVTETPAVTVDMVKVAYSPIVLDSEGYDPEMVIEEEGVEYELSDMEVDSEESVYVQEVSTYTDYSHEVSTSTVPQTKETTVINEKTGATQTVTCALSSVDQTGTETSQSYIDIVFKEYDAETFVWGNYTISKNEEKPALDGTALLASVGLDTQTSYVTDVYWVGEAYESDDVLYRNARADVMTMGDTYRATYTGTITTTGTVYKMTYTGRKSSEAGTPIYEIEATATYERNTSAVAVVSTALVVLAGLIVVLLVLLSRKRKGQDETNRRRIEMHMEDFEEEGDDSWNNL